LVLWRGGFLRIADEVTASSESFAIDAHLSLLHVHETEPRARLAF
jgi:hypothetical protein